MIAPLGSVIATMACSSSAAFRSLTSLSAARREVFRFILPKGDFGADGQGSLRLGFDRVIEARSARIAHRMEISQTERKKIAKVEA